MWAELAKDAAGILLFVVWLAIPPLYVAVLGRSYLEQCRLTYQELRDHGCECDCCCGADSGRHRM